MPAALPPERPPGRRAGWAHSRAFSTAAFRNIPRSRSPPFLSTCKPAWQSEHTTLQNCNNHETSLIGRGFRHSPTTNHPYPRAPFRSMHEGSCREIAPEGARLIVGATLRGSVMFAIFERLLQPTVAPEGPEPP